MEELDMEEQQMAAEMAAMNHAIEQKRKELQRQRNDAIGRRKFAQMQYGMRQRQEALHQLHEKHAALEQQLSELQALKEEYEGTRQQQTRDARLPRGLRETNKRMEAANRKIADFMQIIQALQTELSKARTHKHGANVQALQSQLDDQEAGLHQAQEERKALREIWEEQNQTIRTLQKRVQKKERGLIHVRSEMEKKKQAWDALKNELESKLAESNEKLNQQKRAGWVPRSAGQAAAGQAESGRSSARPASAPVGRSANQLPASAPVGRSAHPLPRQERASAPVGRSAHPLPRQEQATQDSAAGGSRGMSHDPSYAWSPRYSENDGENGRDDPGAAQDQPSRQGSARSAGAAHAPQPSRQGSVQSAGAAQDQPSQDREGGQSHEGRTQGSHKNSRTGLHHRGGGRLPPLKNQPLPANNPHLEQPNSQISSTEDNTTLLGWNNSFLSLPHTPHPTRSSHPQHHAASSAAHNRQSAHASRSDQDEQPYDRYASFMDDSQGSTGPNASRLPEHPNTNAPPPLQKPPPIPTHQEQAGSSRQGSTGPNASRLPDNPNLNAPPPLQKPPPLPTHPEQAGSSEAHGHQSVQASHSANNQGWREAGMSQRSRVSYHSPSRPRTHSADNNPAGEPQLTPHLHGQGAESNSTRVQDSWRRTKEIFDSHDTQSEEQGGASDRPIDHSDIKVTLTKKPKRPSNRMQAWSKMKAAPPVDVPVSNAGLAQLQHTQSTHQPEQWAERVFHGPHGGQRPSSAPPSVERKDPSGMTMSQIVF